MTNPESLDPALAELGDRLRAAMASAGLPSTDPGFERPRQAEHGDWASTVALRLSKEARRPPRDIAAALVDGLDLPALVESVEVAGPGFLNFRFAHAWHEQLVRRVLADGDSFGRFETDEPETVNLEFVSANPTGPLHMGAGRWAATGDSIAALLEAEGHRVVREYYVNDAGEQVRRFGESVVLAHRGLELTDLHYRGAYVAELAAELAAQHGPVLFEPRPGDAAAPEPHAVGAGHNGATLVDDEVEQAAADPRVEPGVAARVGPLAVAAMRTHIEQTLHGMSVDYDVWFSEQSLHDSGAIVTAVDQLRDAGHTYEQDGALFLRTADKGDDKDRVLVRSDGRPTYFAADCAYILDKWSRSDRLLYLLGSDHHGYVARLHAVAECLAIPRDSVEVRIGQLVNLMRDGEPVRMSKRAGELITLDEVLEDVGVDVARYHFLRQGLDTQVDFDLSVVSEQSMENPVYYVQYAHARIASLVRTADERGFDPGKGDQADLSMLTHEAELALLSAMGRLPQTVAEAADLRATQRLARYAEDLAGTFHRFYTECRVLVDDQDLARARYWLARAAKQVLANALALLRVSAPEHM